MANFIHKAIWMQGTKRRYLQVHFTCFSIWANTHFVYLSWHPALLLFVATPPVISVVMRKVFASWVGWMECKLVAVAIKVCTKSFHEDMCSGILVSESMDCRWSAGHGIYWGILLKKRGLKVGLNYILVMLGIPTYRKTTLTTCYSRSNYPTQ